MRDSRFYSPDFLSPGAELPLSASVARHAVRVLRLQCGDALTLFDGSGGEYLAEITHIQREQVMVKVGSWRGHELESPCRVRLLQALQASDKMDFTLQKAVELGVAAIQPLQTRRSVVRLTGEREQKRRQHWQGVVVAACEQCGRNRVPEVAPLLDLADCLAQISAQPASEPVLRIMLAPGAEQSLLALAPPPSGQVDLLIGAEGGLEAEEGQWAQRVGFIPVSLGPRILRTETASLAALAVIQGMWGDWR